MLSNKNQSVTYDNQDKNLLSNGNQSVTYDNQDKNLLSNKNQSVTYGNQNFLTKKTQNIIFTDLISEERKNKTRSTCR